MTIALDRLPDDLWVFGYGSLMWRPGFAFVEKVPARVTGLHRSLCVYSFVHRGTPEHPGLVLGLDRGGACRGLAFRIAPADRADVVRYLRAREQVTSVYVEILRGVWLLGQPERRVQALTYVVDRGHPQYAGRLTLDQRLHYIRQGHGQSGANRDYVLSTVAALEDMGCRDAELHALAERLKGAHDGHAAAAHAGMATPAAARSR
jgi:cation transport protein ChaC